MGIPGAAGSGPADAGRGGIGLRGAGHADAVEPFGAVLRYGIPQAGLRASRWCPILQHPRSRNRRRQRPIRSALSRLSACRRRRLQGVGAFKQRLAISAPNLMDYGQIKAPATDILMAAAERWAADTGGIAP